MYYVLTRDGNTFIGVTTDNAYSFNLPNVSIHEKDGPIPDLNKYTWDFNTDEFIRSTSDVYTKVEFLSRFTTSERLAARASSDMVVADLMNMLELAEYISINDPATIQGINYLAYVGILAPNRVQEILS